MKLTVKYWIRMAEVGLMALTLVIAYYVVSVSEFVKYHDGRKLYAAYRCWQAAPSWHYCSSQTPFDFDTDFFGMRYKGKTDNLIDIHILYYGAYEKYILYFLQDVMTAIAPKGGVFVDVGANTGEYSLFMSRHAREVHAFEPYEPVIQRFRHMVEINRLSNVKIYPVGLGDRNAKVPFFSPPQNNQGTGSYLTTWGGDTPYKDLEIVVGDEVLQKRGVRHVDLIKVDVEGYEKPVLRGLSKTLKESRPVVHFELTTKPDEAVTFKSAREFLTVFPENYKLIVFEDEKADRYTGRYHLAELIQFPIDFDVVGRYDVIAFPIERDAQIPRTGPK